MIKVFVGSKKDELYRCSASASVQDATGGERSFVEYKVETGPTGDGGEQAREQRTVIDLLMQNAASQSNLPPRFERAKMTGILRLKNDIIAWLENNNVGWSVQNTKSLGLEFVNTLGDALWYVDGHHHTLHERGHGVPNLFKQFQGYNCPEKAKHRKRSHSSLSIELLDSHSQMLFDLAGKCFMKRMAWTSIREAVLRLADNLRKYKLHLEVKNSKVQSHHKLFKSASELEEYDIRTHPAQSKIKPRLSAKYKDLHDALLEAENYQPICMNEFMPAADRKDRHEFLRELVMPSRYTHLKYTGGPTHLHFVWRVPIDADLNELNQRSKDNTDTLRPQFPKHHTRAMKREFIHSFGRVTNSKPAVLRQVYRALTGDKAKAETMSEQEVDDRLSEILEMEDDDMLDIQIVMDRRANNQGRPAETYKEFLNQCKIFLEQEVGTAVNDRRHDAVDQNEVVVHMARALSANDLHRQVTERCLPDTPIPSVQWLRLQFWPKRPTAAAARYHSGALKVKMMVQSRQVHKSHKDCHYASAINRYVKEFAVKYRDHCTFVSQDDKHTVKIGEPGYPLAAAERGKQVIVGMNETFAVGDHDFTMFNLTPSVSHIVDIPETMEGSFYRGDVYVGFKNTAFQASSPLRHAAELNQILNSRGDTNPILLATTDGGNDHNTTRVATQCADLSLFLSRDLDFLCHNRTPPYNSWKNIAERDMSILNLGLQGVGLMRAESEFDDKLSKCSNTADVRKLAEKTPGLERAVLDSMQQPITLLETVTCRLYLKDRPFQIFHAATTQNIDDMWDNMQQVDDSLLRTDTTKKLVKNKEKFQEFIKKHCVIRHYFFSVKKCLDLNCCRPPRLPQELFQSLHHLPDPMPNGDHYKAFNDSYGTETTENFRPSMKESDNNKSGKHGMPFTPSSQYAKNVGLVIQCDECLHWRCIYSKKKLKERQKEEMGKLIEDILYCCGASMKDIPYDEGSVLEVSVSLIGSGFFPSKYNL